ncbi:hypothetical protein GCM10010407_11030 [Rarobacter incanus]
MVVVLDDWGFEGADVRRFAAWRLRRALRGRCGIEIAQRGRGVPVGSVHMDTPHRRFRRFPVRERCPGTFARALDETKTRASRCVGGVRAPLLVPRERGPR